MNSITEIVNSMQQLENTLTSAIDNERCTGVKVEILMPDLPEPELIENPKANLPNKLEYYKKAYDEELKLKSFNQIRINAITTFLKGKGE